MRIDKDDVKFGIFIGVIILMLIGPFVVASQKEAKLINDTYGTSYTGWDMFFTGTAIKEIVIGTKHRIDMKDD